MPHATEDTIRTDGVGMVVGRRGGSGVDRQEHTHRHKLDQSPQAALSAHDLIISILPRRCDPEYRILRFAPQTALVITAYCPRSSPFRSSACCGYLPRDSCPARSGPPIFLFPAFPGPLPAETPLHCALHP